MEKLSFFKLPLIFIGMFVTINFLKSCVTYIIVLFSIIDNFSFWPTIFEFMLNNLFHLILPSLLLFVVSSIAFYRMNIHIITVKNVGLLVIIVLLIMIFSFLFNRGNQLIYQLVYDKFFVNITKADSWVFALPMSAISRLVYFSLESLLIYYYIKIFGSWFNKSRQDFELTANNSSKIHFTLFLAFFFFLFITSTNCLTRLPSNLPFYNSYYVLFTVVPIFIYVIAFLLITLITKNLFKRTFVVLQSDRIIKSAVMTNLLILIIDAVFAVILFSTDYLPNKIGLLIVIYYPKAILIFAVILSCLFVKRVTQYYFAKPTNG